ncbi:hypothetical protein UCA_00595 [Enterococcus faecalis EnGen0237]|nr:hypothetical protein UCA_00595 [Enterococcus faecalis EnGen0237]
MAFLLLHNYTDFIFNLGDNSDIQINYYYLKVIMSIALYVVF